MVLGPGKSRTDCGPKNPEVGGREGRQLVELNRERNLNDWRLSELRERVCQAFVDTDSTT